HRVRRSTRLVPMTAHPVTQPPTRTLAVRRRLAALWDDRGVLPPGALSRRDRREPEVDGHSVALPGPGARQPPGRTVSPSRPGSWRRCRDRYFDTFTRPLSSMAEARGFEPRMGDEPKPH